MWRPVDDLVQDNLSFIPLLNGAGDEMHLVLSLFEHALCVVERLKLLNDNMAGSEWKVVPLANHRQKLQRANHQDRSNGDGEKSQEARMDKEEVTYTIIGTDNGAYYTQDSLIVNNITIPIVSYRNPYEIPWKKYNVKYVCDCTGVFTTQEKAQEHIKNNSYFAIF